MGIARRGLRDVLLAGATGSESMPMRLPSDGATAVAADFSLAALGEADFLVVARRGFDKTGSVGAAMESVEMSLMQKRGWKNQARLSAIASSMSKLE
jgi:hypothetical protein